jgi:hypothetical protein
MVNPERIELKSCFTFIRRQLLTVRLHHPHWPLVRAVGIGSGITLLTLLVVLTAAAVVGDWLSAALMAAVLATFGLGIAGAIGWIDASLRSTAHKRSERLPACSWKLALAGPLAQVLYFAALVSVSFLRRVDWRGITYKLDGPTPVRLTAYHPYHPDRVDADRTASVV